jgi:hypothetical protein
VHASPPSQRGSLAPALRCDNEASAFSALALTRRRVQSQHVNQQELTEIHQTLEAVHDTVGSLTFPRCDQDDVFELIDRVESELASAHPNVQIIDTFLNSLARSLRAEPDAREACLRIEEVLERTGLPSTWQAGI